MAHIWKTIFGVLLLLAGFVSFALGGLAAVAGVWMAGLLLIVPGIVEFGSGLILLGVWKG